MDEAAALIAEGTPALVELAKELIAGGMPPGAVITHIVDSSRARADFDQAVAQAEDKKFGPR